MATSDCPECKEPLRLGAQSCACGWRKAPLAKRDESNRRDPRCPWNDYGHVCGRMGSLSTGGPWYCREHFAKLMGWPDPQSLKFETEGEAVVRLNAEAWRFCRGKNLNAQADMVRWMLKKTPEIGRIREPGDDDEEIRQEVTA